MREIARVVAVDFLGVASEEANVLEVMLSGTADYTSQSSFEELINRVQTEAKRMHARETIVDLTKLEFMNSSCFKVFVSWISDLQESSNEERYLLRFRSNPNHHWQKRSLASLRHFAVDLITIETV